MNKKLFDLVDEFARKYRFEYAIIGKPNTFEDTYLIVFQDELSEDELFDDSLTIQVSFKDGKCDPVININDDFMTLKSQSLLELTIILDELRKIRDEK